MQFQSIKIDKHILFILTFHSGLFFVLLISAFLLFQTDLLSSLWANQTPNDCRNFIANTLNLLNPPYPCHPIATSFHFFLPYSILNLILPTFFALTLGILITQYTASISALFLLNNLFKETFNLTKRNSLVLLLVIDLIVISPFLLMATAEILFLFYQLLAWTLFTKRKYFLSLISAAMTFAIRFNGAFFVLGIFIYFVYSWRKENTFSWKNIIFIIFTLSIMFIIGFSSFFLSWWAFDDFWLPLTSQYQAFQMWGGYTKNNIVNIPFIWWIDYIRWVFTSNSLLELLFLITASVSSILGFISIIALIVKRNKGSENNISHHQNALLLIFSISFIGLNIIESGRNMARFLSFTFPFYPILPIWFNNRQLKESFQVIIVLTSVFIGFVIIIVWWMFFISFPNQSNIALSFGS